MIKLESHSLVFVYGSLRMHEGNHRMLGDSELVAKQCVAEGSLFDTGFGFPAMVVGGGERVYGELYRVTPEILSRLDVFEGFYGKGRNNYYERVIQSVSTDKGCEDAFIYVYLENKTSGMSRIEYGDWKFHRIQNLKSSMTYYAYGSCMDDVRLKKAQKDHLFQDVLGRGILDGYTMKFLRKGIDGTGKADLVESGGGVEGKVYRIGSVALDYLVGREGVRSYAYRPAFVDIYIGNKMITDVLTFLAVDKEQKEISPNEQYLEEICRGGKTVWSMEYERRFEERILTISATTIYTY